MKYEILTDILFELLSKRKVTARYLAEKHATSERTIYRYLDILAVSVPLQIQRGRNGGVFISDSYKLPVNFMTKEEYGAAIEALGAMYSQLPEERFLAARRKLSAQAKSESRDLTLSGTVGTILVDSGTWGDTRSFSEKLRLLGVSAIVRCWRSIIIPAWASIPTAESNRTCSCLSKACGTSMRFAEKSAPFGCSDWGESPPPY